MLVQEAASELIEMLLDVGEDQIAPKGFKCFLIQCIHYRLNGSRTLSTSVVLTQLIVLISLLLYSGTLLSCVACCAELCCYK